MPKNRSSGRKSSQDKNSFQDRKSLEDNKSSEGRKSDVEQNQPQKSQQQHLQQRKSKQQAKPQRKLSQIRTKQNKKENEIEESQSPENEPKNNQITKPQLQTQTPNRYSLYRQTFNFNWNMKDFDISKAVESFGKLDQHPELQDTDEEDFQKQISQLKDDTIKLRVYKSNKQTTGLTKKTTYFVTGRDKTGQFEISRYYHEFVLLREKLLLRWPGCFIPPIPTKKFGNNPYELVLIRMRYLNNFLKGLSRTPEIYYGQECQIFFKHDGDYVNTNGKLIEQELQKLKAYQNPQLLEKYKEVYSSLADDLSEQEQSIAISEIKGLQEELKSWKVDMSRFKEELRFLIVSKDKYYQAMTRLSTVLLPEFQSVILDWINEDNFNKQSLQNEPEKQSHKQGYLLNTEQYGNTLKDAALSVRNYNQSLWIIYDIFKFELKQTDAILEAIQSYEFLLREMQYLNRNLNINKDQLESLDEKKTTLKIFMMGGTVEEKRSRINKESESFQEKLSVVKDLLNLVLNRLINSIDNFHNHRAETYKRLLAKSSHEELVLVKKLMDFHIFELQTFRKKESFSQRREQKIERQEEIVEEDNE